MKNLKATLFIVFVALSIVISLGGYSYLYSVRTLKIHTKAL